MDKYNPEGDKKSTFTVYGYSVAQTLVQALEQCGDDLTRANVMKQATNLKDVKIQMLLPGITVNTGPNDYFPIEQMTLGKFNRHRRTEEHRVVKKCVMTVRFRWST